MKLTETSGFCFTELWKSFVDVSRCIMLKFIHEDKRWIWSCSTYCEGGVHLGIVFMYCVFWRKMPCNVLAYDRAKRRLMLCPYKHTYTCMCFYILIGFLGGLCVEADNNIGIYKLTGFQTCFLFFYYFYQILNSRYSMFIEYRYKYIHVQTHWLFCASVRKAPHHKEFSGCFANKK